MAIGVSSGCLADCLLTVGALRLTISLYAEYEKKQSVAGTVYWESGKAHMGKFPPCNGINVGALTALRSPGTTERSCVSFLLCILATGT